MTEQQFNDTLYSIELARVLMTRCKRPIKSRDEAEVMRKGIGLLLVYMAQRAQEHIAEFDLNDDEIEARIDHCTRTLSSWIKHQVFTDGDMA